MVREALEDVNTCETLIYVRDDWYHHFKKMLKHRNIRKLPDIPYLGYSRADAARNWGSGTYALIVSSMLEHENIYVLGFDLYGIQNLVNNIYKGTKNYAGERSHAIDPSYWIYQSSRIFDRYKNKKYIIVNHPSWKFPDQWKLPNVDFLSVSKLVDQLQLQ
jgi:endo-1,4-beta-D-glucanase Y